MLPPLLEVLSMIYAVLRPQPAVRVKGSIDTIAQPAELCTLCRELRPVNDGSHYCNVRCRSRNSRLDPETCLSAALNLKLRFSVGAGRPDAARASHFQPLTVVPGADVSTSVSEAGSPAALGSPLVAVLALGLGLGLVLTPESPATAASRPAASSAAVAGSEPLDGSAVSVELASGRVVPGANP